METGNTTEITDQVSAAAVTAAAAPAWSAAQREHYGAINDLVAKAQQGEGEALVALADFYQPLVRASVKRVLGRDRRLVSRREDVFSDTLIVLSELVKRFDPELSYFSYYLSTRLDKALLSYCRHTYFGGPSNPEEIVFSDLPDTWEPEDQDDPFNRIAEAYALRLAVDKLPDKQHEAIDLSFYQGLNQAEASVVLGISQGAYSKRLSRALIALRKIMAAEEREME